MKIQSSIQTFSAQYKNQKTSFNFKSVYSALAPLKRDTISFGAMKKNQFEGLDYVVIEKFKAPIEKFNSLKDFQSWSNDMAKALTNKDFKARQPWIEEQRKETFEKWIDYIFYENKEYSNSARLLILNDIAKGLKADNDAILPVLNKGVLADTIYEIEKNAKNNKNYQPDFKKIYETNLRELYLDNDIKENGETGWVVTPSLLNDREHFNENVEKLKSLSHKNWCTKSYNAEPYLMMGDFHIYLENGNPKLAVRFVHKKVEEIQGEQNNREIPILYYDKINKYVKKNRLKLNNNAREEMKRAKELMENIQKTKSVLKDAIKNNGVAEIFKYFKIEVEDIDKDGFLTISCFKEPYGYTLADCGIDESKLLEKVKKISGNARFAHSREINLENLEYIGGHAMFEGSKITNLKNLKYIGGNADFKSSKIKNLENLKYVEGNAYFGNTSITSLENLEYIGNAALFAYSKIKNLENLRYVGGSVDFENAQGVNLKNLKSINNDAYLNFSENINLENLQKIKGNAFLWKAKDINLKNLKTIDGNLRIKGLNIEDFKNVEVKGKIV